MRRYRKILFSDAEPAENFGYDRFAHAAAVDFSQQRRGSFEIAGGKIGPISAPAGFNRISNPLSRAGQRGKIGARL